MKDLYSIGEVSRIMGVSVQTLRYYSSIHLLEPKQVNQSSGYRYYSADQFHFIDRIKYLQKLGMSLEEIKEILVDNDIRKLVSHLDALKESCEEKMRQLADTLDTIEWYRDYFAYSEEGVPQRKLSYVRHFPPRHMVCVKLRKDESKDDFHIRLTKLRNTEPFKSLAYMRQYSYVLNYDSLLKNQLDPYYFGMFIKSNPGLHGDDILDIPEGDYYCFRARILSEGWDPYLIRMFFSDRKGKPSLVLANEYEDNLHEYSLCPYEVQILIPGGADARETQGCPAGEKDVPWEKP